MNQLSSATGILINGCASGFSGSRRRRRSIVSGGVETRSSSCVSSESSDPSLSSDVFDEICSTDASIDSNLASAATQAVSSLDTLKSVDSSTFSRAATTLLLSHSTKFYTVLLCLVINFFLVNFSLVVN